ncbi:hypothetical protein IF2G_02222 [Cordyceps javanica]|nr:hypothetical protein IF2G_02222 [Cordyceps javanica]
MRAMQPSGVYLAVFTATVLSFFDSCGERCKVLVARSLGLCIDFFYRTFHRLLRAISFILLKASCCAARGAQSRWISHSATHQHPSPNDQRHLK